MASWRKDQLAVARPLWEGQVRHEAARRACCGEPRQVVQDDGLVLLVCIGCESVVEAETESLDRMADHVRFD